MLGARRRRADVEPPAALRRAHQGRPFQRLGAEPVLVHLGDRGEAHPVGRAGDDVGHAAALAHRHPHPVGEVDDVPVPHRARRTGPRAVAAGGRLDDDLRTVPAGQGRGLGQGGQRALRSVGVVSSLPDQTRTSAGADRGPVGVRVAGDVLQQGEVVDEVWQQRGPFVCARPGPGAGRPPVQRRQQRAAEHLADRLREPVADRAAQAQCRAQGGVHRRVRHERGDVLPRYAGQQAGADAEEPADRVECPLWTLAQVAVAEHQHLLAREDLQEVGDLLAVPALGEVVPEVRPPGGPARRLGRAGREEVGLRLQPGRPQVRPVGMGPVDRVAEHEDDPCVRDERVDPPVRRPLVQVERGGLAAQRARRRRVEQRLVVGSPPDVLLVGLPVAGAARGRRRAVRQEELGLLDGGQEELRVPDEGGVERGGACLGHPRHQEVR